MQQQQDNHCSSAEKIYLLKIKIDGRTPFFFFLFFAYFSSSPVSALLLLFGLRLLLFLVFPIFIVRLYL